MTFELHRPQEQVPKDWDPGLRQKVLELVSDPTSGIVSFPARRAPKTRHRTKSPTQMAMIPSPHDPRQATGLRLVTRRKSRKGEVALAFSKTIFGSIAIGLIIGGVMVQDRLRALTLPAATATQVAIVSPDAAEDPTKTAMASPVLLPGPLVAP